MGTYRIKQISEYNRNNYDEIKIRVPKGYRERLKALLASENETVNGCISNFIAEKLGEKPKYRGKKLREKALDTLKHPRTEVKEKQIIAPQKYAQKQNTQISQQMRINLDRQRGVPSSEDMSISKDELDDFLKDLQD